MAYHGYFLLISYHNEVYAYYVVFKVFLGKSIEKPNYLIKN